MSEMPIRWQLLLTRLTFLLINLFDEWSFHRDRIYILYRFIMKLQIIKLSNTFKYLHMSVCIQL